MNYCPHLWQFYRSRIWGNKTMRKTYTVITQNYLENLGVTSRDIIITHDIIFITHGNNFVTHGIIFVTHGITFITHGIILATHGTVLCKSVKMIEKGKDLTEIFRFVNILCTKARFLCSRKQKNL